MSDTINPDVLEYYEIVSIPDKPESWCVKLIHPKWYGIIYTYGEVSVNEENDSLRCKMEYDILHAPDEILNAEKSDSDKVEFETLIGKIAMNILYDNTKNLKEQDVENGKKSNKLVITK